MDLAEWCVSKWHMLRRSPRSRPTTTSLLCNLRTDIHDRERLSSVNEKEGKRRWCPKKGKRSIHHKFFKGQYHIILKGIGKPASFYQQWLLMYNCFLLPINVVWIEKCSYSCYKRRKTSIDSAVDLRENEHNCNVGILHDCTWSWLDFKIAIHHANPFSQYF